MGNINSQETVFQEKRNALKKLYNMNVLIKQLTERVQDGKHPQNILTS